MDKPYNYHTLELQRLIGNSSKPKKQPIKNIEIKSNIMNTLNSDLSKCKISGNVVFLPPIQGEKLEDYAGVKKALINAGAKYQRSTFVFPNDAQPYIDRITGGESVNIKKGFQFFPTPQKIATMMALHLDFEAYHTILEPSAGQGALIEALYEIRCPELEIHYCELMDINRDIVAKKQLKTKFMGDDFLKHPISFKYDRIIANPPFTKNQDIEHIRKMYDHLNDGGVLVTLSSKSWQLGSSKKQQEFKDWLDTTNYYIETIDAGEFKSSGTMIETLMIVINK